MKIHILYFLLFIILFSDTLIDAKKSKAKKKKKKDKKDEEPIEWPDVSSYKRPDGMPAGLYCEACTEVVKLAVTNLYGKRTETEVFDVLADNLCNPFNYQGFYYDAMDMVYGCEVILQGWETELEALLTDRDTDDKEDLAMRFCGV